AEQVRLFEKRRESHRKSRASARAILRRPTASWRGERIKLFINIQRVDDLEHADAQYADGIGLMRTEFLLTEWGGLPDEETQFEAYDAVLRWADRRPVTIRTFDAGGDKPLAGGRHCRNATRAGNHGRSPGGGPGGRDLQGLVLLDRLERPRAICPRLRSFQWCSRPLDGSAASGSARTDLAHRGARAARWNQRQPVRRHGKRSALPSRFAQLRLARAFRECVGARAD